MLIRCKGQFPGPTIEARSGDTLEVEVSNLLDVGVSLHWHGLYMRGILDDMASCHYILAYHYA